MKLLVILFLVCGLSVQAQLSTPPVNQLSYSPAEKITIKLKEKVKPDEGRWRITGNHLLTGGLVFTAGAARGFNETLTFHWKGFAHAFPGAKPGWFNPDKSWRNKYKGGDPDAGAKFPLSTSVLVMFTDQYHLNNFINKASLATALVIKIGEGKRPFLHYVLDFLYYTACHQLGFVATYYPFKDYRE